MKKRLVLAASVAAALLMIAIGWALIPAAHLTPVAAQRGVATRQIADDASTPTVTPTITPSPTPIWCPTATPEPLWVEPVVSPTDLLTQTITVRIGNGEAVTVTAESGVFTATGSFNAYSRPAQVTIGLLPAITHHLDVWAKVRRVERWGCVYGDYTLHTARDRDGQPLTIVQQRARLRYYLPLILR